jgi:pyruvate formate lyase activating enzyme
VKEILKDKIFYENSGGGVTFSGGECMLQIDFLEEILKECKTQGIHTAIDTAGHIPYSSFERILPYTDLFLYDIKCMDSEMHKRYTGVSNELILANLARLLKSHAPIWVRIPIINGVNDTVEEMLKIRSFFEENGFPERIELLPYHAMGEHKYGALGRECHSFSVPDEDKMKLFREVFDFSH